MGQLVSKNAIYIFLVVVAAAFAVWWFTMKKDKQPFAPSATTVPQTGGVKPINVQTTKRYAVNARYN